MNGRSVRWAVPALAVTMCTVLAAQVAVPIAEATTVGSSPAAGGAVWTWGYNKDGELGDGTFTNRSLPAEIPRLDEVTSVSTTAAHNLVVRTDGTVWGWGGNFFGELGNGTTTSRAFPVQTVGLGEAVAASAGWYFSLGLLADGSVWAWGKNQYGTLGDGTTEDRVTPVPVKRLKKNVVGISAGDYASLAVKRNGSVWVWGSQYRGDGSDDFGFHRPQKVPFFTDAIAVGAGGDHSVVLRADGTVWGWGSGPNGELGDGSFAPEPRLSPVQAIGVDDVVAISTSAFHTLAIRSDATAWAWGGNSYGTLGDGTTIDRNVAIQVSNLANVVSVAAAGNHSLAALADGTAWAWGSNQYGQLGDGTKTERHLPVQVQGLAGVTEIDGSGVTYFWGHSIALTS